MNANSIISILLARKWIILLVFFLTVSTTVIVSLLLPKSYTASTSLVLDFKGNDPLGTSSMPVQLSSTYMSTQVDILNSHRVALKVVDLLKLDQNATALEEFRQDTEGRGSVRDWLADAIVKKLDVIPSRDSRIITLEYTSTDSRFAKILANAFAQAYINTILELSIDPARRSASWFEDQLKSLRENVETAQTKLTKYQSKHGIIATDERLDTETAKLNALSAELVAAQAKSLDAESRINQADRLIRNGVRESETIPEVMSNGFVQSLKAEILRQQAKLDELSRTVGDNHPTYQSAKAEIESLRGKLISEIKNVASGLENTARLAREREAQLGRAVASQKVKLLEFKQQREELNVLLNEVDSARRVYDVSLQRANQINLESQINQTNASVLAEAVEPMEHSSPKIFLNTIISFVLGTLLSFGTAFLLEANDRRIRTKTDITDNLGLPLLGVMRADKKSKRGSKLKKNWMSSGKNGYPKPVLLGTK